LCDAVTGQTDGHATLLALEQANLFLIALDNERQWYRITICFSDFLLVRAQESLGEHGLAESHRRASDWHKANGFVDDAVRHSLAARDFEFSRSADREIRRSSLFAWRDVDVEELV